MDTSYQPIVGGPDRFALTSGPDGVYRVDGRVIPVSDDAPLRIDNGEPVVAVHALPNERKGVFGAVLGLNVEQRVLELPVR